MVAGLDRLRDHFAGFEDRYVLIGGAACYLSMLEVGEEFRATKDLDIVLCMEVLDAPFGRAIWEFVRLGEYEHQEKSTGGKQFYRFYKPKVQGYPYMLELFSRVPDQVALTDDAHLTPIPMEQEVSSLSAILLNEAYYQFIHQGRRVVDGLPFIGAEHIIPLKANAWMDLTDRKQQGIHVDESNIKKHKNDVFRLATIVDPEYPLSVPESIVRDMAAFLDRIRTESIDLKSLGIKGVTLTELIDQLGELYVHGG